MVIGSTNTTVYGIIFIQSHMLYKGMTRPKLLTLCLLCGPTRPMFLKYIKELLMIITIVKDGSNPTKVVAIFYFSFLLELQGTPSYVASGCSVISM
jgi:hypothetical protein